MPEGDTIHAAARRVGAALVGKELVSIETPQPRDALLDQRNIAGIGVGDVTDEEALRIVRGARLRMQEPVSRGGHMRGLQVYDRSGRKCARCNSRIRARGQGDANRTTYWCPGCQA